MELQEEVDLFYSLFAGMVAMFLLSGGVVAFFMLYQRKLFRHQLQLQEMDASYKEQLLHSTIEKVEDERRRISKDLHDDLGSLLSTLNIKLDELETTLTPSQATAKALDESKGLIDRGIKSVRRISHGILPPSLELFGLVAALEDLCSQVSSPALKAECLSHQVLKECERETALALYRIVQELISNTLRHAKASSIGIVIENYKDKLIITYRDNGKGFSLQDKEKRKGLGLLNIESRVNMIKGNIQYETEPGKGLAVRIELPETTYANTY